VPSQIRAICADLVGEEQQVQRRLQALAQVPVSAP
jgi:hypothetical protein